LDDIDIIALYWARDQRAIAESERSYGAYCRRIADHILARREDTEECVNDTWLRSWNAMPPQRPNRLAAFFGKITRNLALDRWRKDRADRRGGGQLPLALEELGDCVGRRSQIEEELEASETAAAISRFLYAKDKMDRQLFVRRYWYLESIRELEVWSGLRESQIKSRLHRMRRQLGEYLRKEGIPL